jgi:methylglutaconyl-CoA hydratase
MQAYDTVEVDRDAHVARVWMNRPDIHNAFDETLIVELTDCFTVLGGDEGVRVVVLGGRGKSFSAGADLNWMKKAAGYSAEENHRDALALARMLHALARMPKPTVARVHGAAIGGGTGLTTACDIAIASTSAFFAMSEVRFGIIPAAVSPYVVAAIGARAAHRYFLTAERFDANEARRLGMVHEVCAPDELDARVDAVVAMLLTGGPRAHAAVKDLIRAVADRRVDDALVEDTASRIASIRSTPEAREGIRAFLDKRKPDWLA